MALEDAKNEIDRAVSGNAKGLAYENVFAGVPSFLRRAYSKDAAKFDLVVTGVPFDQAVTHRPGARFGPRAIREASTLLAGDAPYGWGYDPLGRFAIADMGDMAFDYAKMSDVPALIEAHVSAILAQGAACLSFGGDHSTTLANLRAHAAKHGPLGFLQFDAHPDTWSDDDPARVDHGTFVYKAMNEGILDPKRIVQVGTRVEVEDEAQNEITRIDARTFHNKGPEAVAEMARQALGDAPVYLSFDIDALDPAYAPGTGTPQCGGLTTTQSVVILRELAGINLVGADVVEVSPPYDHAGITALAGATIAYDLIALWGWNRR